MSDEPLLTLRQVADALGLPESTTRYYRDAFLEHLPLVGTGRRRRYPPQAVAVLRSIAEGYAAGLTHEAIATSLDGGAPRPTPRRPGAPGPRPGSVSNLELLAAIVDGEREQRDAMWQMAQEIVRLTDVLEGQERVLGEIALHAGAQPALASGAAASEPKAIGAGSGPAQGAGAEPWHDALGGPRMPFVSVEPAASVLPSAPAAPAPPVSQRPAAVLPAAAEVAASDAERLRDELERERELVERLREAKVRLEHRVTDAEAELDEQRRRRGSVLGRILGPAPRDRGGA
jgi:DNA-binding transcriptional MerR regulator